MGNQLLEKFWPHFLRILHRFFHRKSQNPSLNLTVRRILCLIGLIVLWGNCFSQADSTQVFSERPISIGFMMGTPYSITRVEKSDWTAPSTNYQDSLRDITAGSNPGIMLGLTLNKELSRRLSFSQAIGVRLSDILFVYQDLQNLPDTIDLDESLFFIAPTLRLSFSDKNLRPLLSLGTEFAFTLYKKERPLVLKPSNFLLKAAVGARFRIGKSSWILPEVGYSLGLVNRLNDDRSIYTMSLSRVHTDYIFLAISFF